MIHFRLSRYTMEERDLGPVDFKHELYVKQLTMMVCIAGKLATQVHRATFLPYLKRVYPSTYVIILSQWWVIERSPTPPIGDSYCILKGRGGLSSHLEDKSHETHYFQLHYFLGLHSKKWYKTLSMRFKMIFFSEASYSSSDAQIGFSYRLNSNSNEHPRPFHMKVSTRDSTLNYLLGAKFIAKEIY